MRSIDPADVEQFRKQEALQRAQRQCFEGRDRKLTRAAQLVLGDLALFCYQTASLAATLGAFRPEDVLIVEGRRQVYLRLVAFLRASEQDLWEATVVAKRLQIETPEEDQP